MDDTKLNRWTHSNKLDDGISRLVWNGNLSSKILPFKYRRVMESKINLLSWFLIFTIHCYCCHHQHYYCCYSSGVHNVVLFLCTSVHVPVFIP